MTRGGVLTIAPESNKMLVAADKRQLRDFLECINGMPMDKQHATIMTALQMVPGAYYKELPTISAGPPNTSPKTVLYQVHMHGVTAYGQKRQTALDMWLRYAKLAANSNNM